jgi:cation transporter-like permease
VKRGNPLPKAKENRELHLLFTSTIIFLLSLAYVLIITNPPSGLLRYDDNLKTTVTKQLSPTDFKNNAGAILLFLIIFALLAGILGDFCDRLSESIGNKRILALTIIPLFALGFILLPYYGFELALTNYGVGSSAFAFGLLVSDWREFRYYLISYWAIVAFSTSGFLLQKWRNLLIPIALLIALLMIILAFSNAYSYWKRKSKLKNRKRPHNKR